MTTNPSLKNVNSEKDLNRILIRLNLVLDVNTISSTTVTLYAL